MDLYPSRSVLDNLAKRDIAWADLVSDLESPETNLPIEGFATRRRISGTIFEAYVEPWNGLESDGWLIVGARARRSPAGPAEPVVGVEAAVAKRRRSGGSGNRWPTTWEALVARILEIPGCRIVRGSKHLLVFRGEEKIETLPITASDHRALMNSCHQLKRKGVDVSRRGLTLVSVYFGVVVAEPAGVAAAWPLLLTP